VAFGPPEDLCPLYSALIGLHDFDWTCFSSPRAVTAVVTRVHAPPEGLKVAAVGPSTAAALAEAHWPVHLVPEEATGEGLVTAFRQAGGLAGARVFFPASAIARDVIPEGLRALGAHVDQRIAYRMISLAPDPEACRTVLDSGELHAVTFASPSAVEGLRAALGEPLFSRLAREVPAAAMGPTTAETLREAGWSQVEVAGTPNMEGLVEAAENAVGRGASLAGKSAKT